MSPLIRLYPACNNGDIQRYKYWVSRCAHKFTVQKVEGGAGKMVQDNHAHQTEISVFVFPFVKVN